MADVKEWGARFNFPENLKIEYDGYSGGISNQIAVKMAEKYDDFIVSQIAMEARAEGICDLTVLNKWAILEAIRKQTPQRVTDGTCPKCHRIFLFKHGETRKGNYCDNCGQALEWEEA